MTINKNEEYNTCKYQTVSPVFNDAVTTNQ